MIAIVDYGMGNLRSVQKAIERVGGDALITRDVGEISGADGLILPGVGAFGLCMENLARFKLIEPVKSFIDSGKPFLGICLGLQLLFEQSEEFGTVKGLGVLKGKVVRFKAKDGDIKIPHLGWNEINIVQDSPILKGVPEGSYFYFVHSFYVCPQDEAAAMTTTPYGDETASAGTASAGTASAGTASAGTASAGFVSSVNVGNIFATQFHPEKSQKVGLKVLENFCRIVKDSFCRDGGNS